MLDIIRQIRAETSASFCIGAKLNSSDYVQGGLTQDEALQHVRWLSEAGLDFCEISGGAPSVASRGRVEACRRDVRGHRCAVAARTRRPPDDVAPEFFGADKPKAQSASKREAFFAEFSQRAKAVAGPMAIMLTGGLRTRIGMADVVASETADLIGLGRPTAIEPDLPHRLLDPSIPDEQARAVQYEIRGTKIWRTLMPTRLIGSGVAFAYHACAIMSFGAPAALRGSFAHEF